MADLGREGCPKVGTTRNKAAPKVRWDRHLFLESPKVGIFFCGIDVREWPATPFLHAPLTLDAAHRALITAACGEHLALKTILMTHITRLAQARRVTTAVCLHGRWSRLRVGLLQDGLCRIVGAEGDEIDTVDFD